MQRAAGRCLLVMSVYASAECAGKESPEIAERLMTPAAVLIAVGASFSPTLRVSFFLSARRRQLSVVRLPARSSAKRQCDP